MLVIAIIHQMNMGRTDLNLLIYLDVLLQHRNVTHAANQLGISQPAMSNSLRRLRVMFDDPLLVRTSEGMTPTERAEQLKPIIRAALSTIDQAVQPHKAFESTSSDRVFRIMASDYAESTLLRPILHQLRQQAPGVTLDIMTPSDVSFHDVEQGKVDMAINRFDEIPASFHQQRIWSDSFTCLFSVDNPIQQDFSLESYLQAHHIWVSKTGMGVGVGMNPDDVQHLGWVDGALTRIHKKRRISVFTRHYHAAMLLAEEKDLIVTIPTRAARMQKHNPRLIIKQPPFSIPKIDLKMAWSPLLHHNPAHQWMRRLIISVGRQLDS